MMNENGWTLEVVRGRDAGHVYALKRGETVLGGALNGGPGLDLGRHEGDGPRRMAARQAQIDWSPRGLTLSDLDSPGGTFVNRQRLLPGQARALKAGDLIQLGSVQLKVVPGASAPPAAKAASAPPPPRSPSTPPPAAAKRNDLPAPFVLASGVSCRSWDDLLTVSAQRWAALRDELVSGRLAGFLASVQRGEFAPSPQAPGTPDERLDAWLASLPTTTPSLPELDVHPETLVVRAVPGGGTTRQVVAIANTGYRLLRSTVCVDPSSASWIEAPPEFTRAPFLTVDRTEVPLNVRIPETFEAPVVGGLVIDSNGGSRRVEVRIERPFVPPAIPEPTGQAGAGGPALVDWIGQQPMSLRVGVGAAAGLLLRLLVVAGNWIPRAGGPAEALPRLGGPVVAFAAAGSLLAAALATRRGDARDVPPAALAGGCAGVFAAALTVAACRAIEPLLAPTPGLSAWVAGPLWAALGAAVAGLTAWLIPPNRADAPEPSP